MKNPTYEAEWHLRWDLGHIAYRSRRVRRWECRMCPAVGPWSGSFLWVVYGWGRHIDKRHMNSPRKIEDKGTSEPRCTAQSTYRSSDIPLYCDGPAGHYPETPHTDPNRAPEETGLWWEQ